jgi:DNA-binding NarL/FixJ family response regulator
MHHERGRVALAAGDALTAKRHLEDALDLYEANGLPFDAALVRLNLARALRDLDRRNPALLQTQAARETFKNLGAAGQVVMAGQLAEECSPMTVPMADVDVLSPREREVLSLLTRGLSNEEIAAELVLSKHTVRRHVSNILTKLNVPSRTAAVVHALGHKHV